MRGFIVTSRVPPQRAVPDACLDGSSGPADTSQQGAQAGAKNALAFGVEPSSTSVILSVALRVSRSRWSKARKSTASKYNYCDSSSIVVVRSVRANREQRESDRMRRVDVLVFEGCPEVEATIEEARRAIGFGGMSPPILGGDGTVYVGIRGRHDLLAAVDAPNS